MSVNKVILVGYVGQDPAIHYQSSGEPIANISVATVERWKTKTGEKQEKTEWHRVAMFGRLAEIAQQYVKKGGQVYIEGKLQTRKYQDKAGRDTYSTEIVASVLEMLGQRNDIQEHRAPVSVPPVPPVNPDNFSDDIPF